MNTEDTKDVKPVRYAYSVTSALLVGGAAISLAAHQAAKARADSAEEAVAFARKLHSIVTSLGICDGDLSQGSMRFDVNVSLKPKGSDTLGTRTETKNLNSFRFMERAIRHEVERQMDILEDGGVIVQETRLYNGDRDESRSMRTKEEANDYRYFPCPDLLPVEIDDAFIEDARSRLPELPDARRARFKEQYGLNDYDAGILSADAKLAAFFEETVEHGKDAKLAANWIQGEFSARLNAEEKSVAEAPITGAQLGAMVTRIADNTLSSAGAKKVFEAARARRMNGRQTLLFVDEIHRFNRAQQDGFLPFVERGTVTLVGATTENPSFALNAALLSRAQVLILQRLDHEAPGGVEAKALPPDWHY